MSHEKSKTAARFTEALLGAVLALQSVFVGLLISHIQDRGIHHDQQYVTLAAYQADREHFVRSLEEIKLALRDIQKRLEKNQATAHAPMAEITLADFCGVSVTPAQAGVQTTICEGGAVFLKTAGQRTGDLLCQ